MRYICGICISLFALNACDNVKQDRDPSDFDPIDSTDLQSATKTEIPVKSVLTVLDVVKGHSYVAWESEMFFEAPNFTKDGYSLIFNSNGKLHVLKLATDGFPEEIPTGFAKNCNNDHVISPNGKVIGLSNHEEHKNESKIYLVGIGGGTPKLVTQKGPSYLHGWSKDGSKLVYCGERKGEFDIYQIGIDGKNEKRLTTAKGLDDGPEYSPDGRYIYFNSERSGLMQIWRMDPDGQNQIQVTNDQYNNWFPHISPDGKSMVYMAYEKNVKGHPANKYVQLKLLNIADGKVKTIQKLFGGQGTINVNSWSPDSKKIAFVLYEPLKIEQ